VSSTTELTGLVPGVGVLLFETDSESDSDSGQFVQFALIASVT